jgi:STE24 endopeptidase
MEGTMIRAALLIIAAAISLSPAAWAAQPTVDAPPAPAASLAESRPARFPANPAASRHFDPDAATAAYMATLSPQAMARSDAYFEGGYWLMLWDFLLGLGVAALLLGTSLSRRMRDLAERITRVKWLQAAIYGVQYVVLTTLVLLPWAAYEGFFREHQYGMSNQTFGDWLTDWLKSLALGVIFGALALAAVYAVIRKAPRTWWLWGSLVIVGFMVFQIAISPLYLEPVFNKFYPLTESPLKQELLSMARANDIPAKQIFEFDASKQTTKISAHVSGLFDTVQISLNDNLINRSSPEEVEAVLGHEMGHYVLHHVFKMIFFFAVLVVIGFALLAWAFDRFSTWYAKRLGIRGIDDVAGVPLLMALFSLYLFVLTPVLNTQSRTDESEADAFGLSASRQPDGFAQAALALSEYRKMRPGRLEEFLFYDHPSGWQRIHRAMIWKAENLDAADIAKYDGTHEVPGLTP